MCIYAAYLTSPGLRLRPRRLQKFEIVVFGITQSRSAESARLPPLLSSSLSVQVPLVLDTLLNMAEHNLRSQMQVTSLAEDQPRVIGGPLDQAQVRSLLRHRLLPLLPYSITVVRRIQYESRHPSPTSQIYLARASNNISSDNVEDAIKDTNSWLAKASENHDLSTPFIVAYVDLHPAGQTQVWLFASWEIPANHAPPFDSPDPLPPQSPVVHAPDQAETDPARVLLIRSLLDHINTYLVPRRPTSPPEDWIWLRDNKKYLSQPYSTSKVLFGSTHCLHVPFFLTGNTRRDLGLYWKLIFPPSASSLSIPSDVPQGYNVSVLRDHELQTVLDRSPIPRTLTTLRAQTNVGIYETATGDCVAWGFLGKDGSVSSLHVEEPHRGKGLATLLTAELLKIQVPQFGGSSHGDGGVDADGQWWGHVDVEQENVASRKVMQKLGAKPWWGVQWIEIDVGIVAKQMQQEDTQ